MLLSTMGKRKVVLILVGVVGIFISLILWVAIFENQYNILDTYFKSTSSNTSGTAPRQVVATPSSEDHYASLAFAAPCFQLALIATALGAITLWFATRPRRSVSILRDSPDQIELRMILTSGQLFVVAAVSFALLGMLLPAVSIAADELDWTLRVARVFVVGSFFVGSGSITFATVLTFIEVWFWRID